MTTHQSMVGERKNSYSITATAILCKVLNQLSSIGYLATKKRVATNRVVTATLIFGTVNPAPLSWFPSHCPGVVRPHRDQKS